MILSLHTTVCQYASDMITKYNHRRIRESAPGLSVNRMLLCDLPRAIDPASLPSLPPPRPPPHPAAYILYQTHPSVRPLKHIAARKIRIDHEAGNVYTYSAYTHVVYTQGVHRNIHTGVDRAGRSVPANKSVSSVLHICVTCVFVTVACACTPDSCLLFFCARVHLTRERLQRESRVCYRGHCDRDTSHGCASVCVCKNEKINDKTITCAYPIITVRRLRHA